jgi:Fe-S-cluster containining protein
MTDKAKTEFTCVRCGNCCRWSGYVRISSDELLHIAKFMNMSVADFTAEFTIVTEDRTGLSLIEKPDGSCIFFIPSPPSCKIQAVKPVQCKNFPFTWNFEGWEEECEGAIATGMKS